DARARAPPRRPSRRGGGGPGRSLRPGDGRRPPRPARHRPRVERRSPRRDRLLPRVAAAHGPVAGGARRRRRGLAAAHARRGERFLERAGADPNRPTAMAARDRLAGERERSRRQHLVRGTIAAGAGGLALLLALLFLLHGSTLTSAIAQRPSLFPEVARTVA